MPAAPQPFDPAGLGPDSNQQGDVDTQSTINPLASSDVGGTAGHDAAACACARGKCDGERVCYARDASCVLSPTIQSLSAPQVVAPHNMQLTFLCNCHSTKNPESVDIARILDSWILIIKNMHLTFLFNCHSTKNSESVDIARILDYGARARAGGTCLVAVLHAASVIGCWGCATGAASVIVCW